MVRSAQNWFQSKQYVVKIIRKNSQLKKSIFTTLQGCLKDFGVRGQMRKLPLRRSKNRFFGLRVFSYDLDNILLRLKPVLSRSDQTGSSSFYRGKEERALQNLSISMIFDIQHTLFE